MAISRASTVKQYLDELPPERRAVVSAVRKTIGEHVPEGYREMMSFGMICWSVPLTRYPDTYNGQPLCYAALAAQKNYYALYLMNVYQDATQRERLEESFRRAGKKIDMGKSCVRFRGLDDLPPLGEIGAIVATTPVDAFVAAARAAHARKAPAKAGKTR